MLRTRLRSRGGGVSGLPAPPDGYAYARWADGSYELDANNNYVLIFTGV